jgi:hypothetical protein
MRTSDEYGLQVTVIEGKACFAGTSILGVLRGRQSKWEGKKATLERELEGKLVRRAELHSVAGEEWTRKAAEYAMTCGVALELKTLGDEMERVVCEALTRSK